MGRDTITLMINGKNNTVGLFKSLKDSLSGIKANIIVANQAFQLVDNAISKVARSVNAVISPFVKFQQETQNIRTLLNTTDQAFGRLTAGIIEVGKTTPKAMSELTNATYDLISASVSQKSAVAALNVAQRAAVAGSTDVKTAVNGAMATINAYNLSIGDLNRVYDMQFNTVKRGVITFGQLASTIGTVLPSAKTLGASLEEVHAAMAMITKAGFSADQAATVLQRTFDGLADPAKQKAFEKLGITIYDMDGNFRGMVPVLSDLSAKLSTMTDAQKSELFGLLALEQRAQKGFTTLVDKVDEYDRTITEMKGVGEMEKAHAEMESTLQNRWDRLINTVKASMAEWVSEHKSALEDFLGVAESVVDALVNITPEYVKAQRDANKGVNDALKEREAALSAYIEFEKAIRQSNFEDVKAVLVREWNFARGGTDEYFRQQIKNQQDYLARRRNETIDHYKEMYKQKIEADAAFLEADHAAKAEQTKIAAELYNELLATGQYTKEQLQSIFGNLFTDLAPGDIIGPQPAEDAGNAADEAGRLADELYESAKQAVQLNGIVKGVKVTALALPKPIHLVSTDMKETFVQSANLGNVLAGEVTGAVGQVVRGIFEGKAAFEDVGDFVTQIAEGLAVAVAQALALKAVMAAISGIGGLLFHIGGMVYHQGGTIPKAHSGLAVDERIIIAQTGEGIINRQATRNIGGKQTIDYINATGQLPASAGSNLTININGTVIGSDSWVENNLIPMIEKAVARGRSDLVSTRGAINVVY